MKAAAMDNQQVLATEPLGRLLFRLAVPAVTAQLVNALYNIVDRIYIGHIPEIGAMAMTGVGVCMPLILLFTAFAALAGMGGAPRATIMMGKGRHGLAEAILGNCAILLVILAGLLTGAYYLVGERLLAVFGASENTIGYALEYMDIYAAGTVFSLLAVGLNAFISAQGFAKESMVTTIIGAVTNIILDPILIFGFHMGVRGAAAASVAGMVVSALWALRFLTGKKTGLRIRPVNLKLQRRVVLPCLALGLSPFIMQGTESVLQICFNSSLLRYGGDTAVGAMSILSSVMQFSLLPLTGLTQGAQPIVSYNYGAGNGERVRRGFFLLLRACVIYAAVVWLFIMLAPGAFVRLFTSDAKLGALAVRAIRIYMAAALLLGVQLACQQTFIALGNAKASLFLALLRKVILLIPLIYLLPLLMPDSQVTAVFLAEPVADTIAVVTTATMFAVQFRRIAGSPADRPPKGSMNGGNA